MTRQIKFAHITMRGGQEAVLSTVELEPGLYETMLLSPDGEREFGLRSTDKGTAISDFNFLYKQYHVETLTGKYAELAKDLEAAAAYGMEVAANTEDGGTCNFDSSATLNLRGWRSAKVKAAAKAAGVGCSVWNLYGSKRYVFSIPGCGQGNAKMVAAEAMREALQLSGYDAGMYYRMD